MRGRGRGYGREDQQIGNNMRRLRLAAGLPQTAVAAHVGLTYQQVQKYERGQSRLSAAMLHDLALLFHVPCALFFDGLDGVTDGNMQTIRDDETLKTLAALDGVNDPALKVKIRKMVEILAS